MNKLNTGDCTAGNPVCDKTDVDVTRIRMWADTQRDERHKVWLTLGARLPCSNAANIGERKIWTQSEFCKIPLGGKSTPNVYNGVPGQKTAKHHAKFGSSPLSRRCSNEAKTRNPLKFAGVPQTPEPISAVSGRSSPYCDDMWGRHCCLTSFFRLWIRCDDRARQSCAMVGR